APATISTDYLVLHATNDGTGIDPKIGKFPELSKPPFSSYNSYKLLDKNTLQVSKGGTGTFKLPTGREVYVVLKDFIAQQKPGEAPRYVLSTSIETPGGNSFLPLLEVNAKAGEHFFVAGQQYKGGILVIGLKVN